MEKPVLVEAVNVLTATNTKGEPQAVFVHTKYSRHVPLRKFYIEEGEVLGVQRVEALEYEAPKLLEMKA